MILPILRKTPSFPVLRDYGFTSVTARSAISFLPSRGLPSGLGRLPRAEPTVVCSGIPPAKSMWEPVYTDPAANDWVATAVSYSDDQLALSAIEELPAPIEPSAMKSDLTLSGAIELALAANPDLVSASEQLAIADATLDRARAEFYPKLGVSEQYGVTNNPVGAFSFQLNQAQLSLVQDFNNPQRHRRLSHTVAIAASNLCGRATAARTARGRGRRVGCGVQSRRGP